MALKNKKSKARVRGARRKTTNLAKRRNFKKAVKSVVNSMAEDKMAYHANSETALTYFNSNINQTGDMLQVLPNISSGDEENQRDGDQITVKKLTVKGYIRFSPVPVGNIAFCQVGVRLMCLSLKKTSSWDLATSTATPIANSLLRRGGTTVGFSGQLSDLYNPINTDLFTVHGNKTFYLTQNQNNWATQVGYYSLDVKNQIKMFTFDIKMKNKKLKYDDNTNSGLLPTNSAPFLCVGYVYLNGDAGDSIVSNLGLHYQSVLRFEDI